MRKTAVVFLILFSLPAFADPDDQDMGRLATRPGCEEALRPDVDHETEMMFHKYLFSESVSAYVSKRLIISKFDIAYAADPKNSISLEVKKNVSLEILGYFAEWFYRKIKKEKKIPRGWVLANKMGISWPQQENLIEHLATDSPRSFMHPVDERFLEYFLPKFDFYMGFLKATKVLFRPLSMFFRSDTISACYIFCTSIVGLGALYELTHQGSVPPPYYCSGVFSVLAGIPLGTAPLLTLAYLAYEKTIGKSRGRKLLEAKENFSRPEVLQSNPHIPVLPPPNQKALKDVLSELHKAMEGMREYQQRLENTEISLSSAFKFGQEAREIQKLLGEAIGLIPKAGDDLEWINDLQAIVLLEKDILAHLNIMAIKGLELQQRLTADQRTEHQSYVLGELIVDLNDDFRPQIMTQLEQLHLALTQMIQEQLNRLNKQSL